MDTKLERRNVTHYGGAVEMVYCRLFVVTTDRQQIMHKNIYLEVGTYRVLVFISKSFTLTYMLLIFSCSFDRSLLSFYRLPIVNLSLFVTV